MYVLVKSGFDTSLTRDNYCNGLCAASPQYTSSNLQTCANGCSDDQCKVYNCVDQNTEKKYCDSNEVSMLIDNFSVM